MESINQIFKIGDTMYQRVFDKNEKANMIEIKTPKYLPIKQSKFTIYN